LPASIYITHHITIKINEMYKDENALARAGAALGIGLIAGLAGTAAVTLSKKLDAKCEERKPDKTVLDVASHVLDIQPSSREKEKKVVEEVHWAYGACLGVARGALSFLGLRGWKATLVHFAALWYTEKMLFPDLKLAFPDIETGGSLTEEKPESIAHETLHEAIYAITTGIVFDAIMPKT
jgi:hypothetical protein